MGAFPPDFRELKIMKILTRRTKTIKFSFYLTIVILGITLIPHALAPAKAEPRQTFVKEVQVTPTPFIEHPTSQQEAIQQEIIKVFGKDADDAFKILSCENKGLVPDAVNENTNGSIDVGIFQVNSIHGVRAKWLENWKVNIQVAHQIFTEQGNWSAWSCAKKVL